MELIPISRTIEPIGLSMKCWLSSLPIRMDWMLPGIAPTLKRVEVALVAIVQFRDGKLAHEHICGIRQVYWFNSACLIRYTARCGLTVRARY